MNYQEAERYLDSINKLGSVPGLDSIRELLCRLGNPQDNVKYIHIAGTNGKGSVNSFIAAILEAGGYCVGRYTSPAVSTPTEIIKINGRNIDEKRFAGLITIIAGVCTDMEAEGLNHPTRFEIETAAAFMFFNEEKCNFAVIECGMGGRLDATNIINTTICSVITPVSVDHTAFLGKTLKEIAQHKAGIIKEGIPVVSGKQHKITADIIKSTALENKSEYYFTDNDIVNIRYGKDKTVFDYHEFQNIEITLLGTYQPENAVTAIECAKVLRNLGIPISDNDIYSGLKKAVWFGRFSKLGEHPDFIVDGAHNPAGALKLAECLETYYPLGELTFIMGVFSDKDYESILKYCMPYAKSVITIETPDNSRALSSKALAEFIKNNYDVSIHVSNSIEEGVGFAMDNTDTDKAIIAFGSLSHLFAVYEAYISLT